MMNLYAHCQFFFSKEVVITFKLSGSDKCCSTVDCLIGVLDFFFLIPYSFVLMLLQSSKYTESQTRDFQENLCVRLIFAVKCWLLSRNGIDPYLSFSTAQGLGLLSRFTVLCALWVRVVFDTILVRRVIHHLPVHLYIRNPVIQYVDSTFIPG